MQTEMTALAATRFGLGAALDQTTPDGPDALIAQLGAAKLSPDEDALPLSERNALMHRQFEARQLRKKKPGQAGELLDAVTDLYRKTVDADAKRLMTRALGNSPAMLERLAWFWADHFTVAAEGRRRTILTYDLVETAIRPNLIKRFPKMLKSVVKHPAMLVYLDQVRSIGPASRVGKRRNAGLNENLAREVLELHTVGVNGGYTQKDVREFAELLTGLSLDKGDFVFRPEMAEPGAEEVLGKRYGSDKQAALRDVDRALTDLAMRPETARHLSRKLIQHFVTLRPEDSYVEAVADAYLESNGRLMAMYRAMISDPRAWALPLEKAKMPLHYMVSSMRALGVTPQEVRDLKRGTFNGQILSPMAAMGQPLLRPVGPDGWSEEPSDWITPSGLAARVQWANGAVQTRGEGLDPRQFLDRTLGTLASPVLRLSVARAETRHEGLTLVLASPEFNRC